MLNQSEIAEVLGAEAVAEERKGGKPEICACGHPVNKHKPLPGSDEGDACVVLAGQCKCPGRVPVIKVPNARYFMFSTKTGIGHALARGIARTAQEGLADRIEWITPVKCQVFLDDDGEKRCESVDDVRMVREDLSKDIAVNGYVCRKHRLKSV